VRGYFALVALLLLVISAISSCASEQPVGSQVTDSRETCDIDGSAICVREYSTWINEHPLAWDQTGALSADDYANYWWTPTFQVPGGEQIRVVCAGVTYSSQESGSVDPMPHLSKSDIRYLRAQGLCRGGADEGEWKSGQP
jgi:hypothetical protein